MLRRAVFAISLVLGFCSLAAPLIALAQQPATIPRIGFLSAAPLSSITARTEALRQGLRDLGYKSSAPRRQYTSSMRTVRYYARTQGWLAQT